LSLAGRNREKRDFVVVVLAVVTGFSILAGAFMALGRGLFAP
jgi:hypothetical protein